MFKKISNNLVLAVIVVLIVISLTAGIGGAMGYFGFGSGSSVSTPISAGGASDKGLVGYWPLDTSAEKVGSDLVTNGTFDTDTWWTKTQAAITIVGGVASWDGTNTNGQGLARSSLLTLGKTYRIQWEIVSTNGISVRPYVGTYPSGSFTTTGVYEVTMVAASTTFYMFASTNFLGTVDNIIVEELQTGDKTPNSNHGTVYGATVGSDSTTFDGTNDYIDVGNVNIANTLPWTVGFWVKGSDFEAGAANQWFVQGDSSITGISYYSQNRIVVYSNSYSNLDWDGEFTFLNNVWYDIVVASNGTTVSLYVNGSLISTKTPGNGNTQFGINLLGRSTAQYYNGLMSDIRFYNRLLSTSEITALYNNGQRNADRSMHIDSKSKGLVGHWELGEEAEKVGAEILTNAGFESGTSGWSTTGFTVDSSSSVYNEGVQSYRIYEASHNWRAAYQNIPNASTYVGKTVVYSVWMRGDPGNIDNTDYQTGYPHIHTNLDVDGYRWTATNGSNTDNGVTKARFLSSEWVKYTGSYTVETGVTSMDFVVAPLWIGIDPTPKDTAFPGFYIDQASFKILETADSTPSSNHGTVYGATNTTDRKGQSNKALSFDGTDDYIDMGDQDNLIGTGYSFSGWIKPNDLTGTEGIFDKIDEDSAGKEGIVVLKYNAALQVYADSFATDCSDDDFFDIGDIWYHFVAIVDGTGCYIYRNGVLGDTGTATTITDNNVNFYVGQEDYLSRYFTGSIDDVRIYDRAITQTEVTSLYDSYNNNVTSGSLTKGLIGQWDLTSKDLKSSTVLKDATPYSNDGTINGATVGADSTSFDGGDFIDAGSFTNGEYTFSTWIKTSSTDAQGLFQFSGCGFFNFDFTGNEKPLLYLSGSNYRYFADSSAYMDNSWHHVLFYIPGSEQTDITNSYLYIDNTQIANSSTTSATAQGTCSGLKIGDGYSGQSHFIGSISNVRIYNRELSSVERELLYNKGR